MDRQRLNRRFGVANCFIVLPINDVTLVDSFSEVVSEVSAQYRGFDKQCVHSSQWHISLVAVHCSPNALSRVGDALRDIEWEARFGARDVTARSLGAWSTAGGKWVLFAELDRPSQRWVAELAERISRHLMHALEADVEGYFDQGRAWVDVVDKDIYQPHITLACVDPEETPSLVRELEAKSGKSAEKSSSKARKKFSAREKSQRGGHRERVMETNKEKEETFGRQVHLFKKERKRYKNFVFGTQRCSAVNVEAEFVLKYRKDLGPYSPPDDNDNNDDDDELSE